MIIPININLPSDAHDPARPKLPPCLATLGDANAQEIVLIELQGTLEVEGPKDKQLIGTLKIADDNKPTLMIGHHLLEGKYANLPKPLAVLKKVTSSAPQEVDAEDGPVKQKSPEWDMLAIVKRKIVFSKRPMPIVHYKPASTAAAAAPTS